MLNHERESAKTASEVLEARTRPCYSADQPIPIFPRARAMPPPPTNTLLQSTQLHTLVHTCRRGATLPMPHTCSSALRKRSPPAHLFPLPTR